MILLGVPLREASADGPPDLGANAALKYWQAFATLPKFTAAEQTKLAAGPLAIPLDAQTRELVTQAEYALQMLHHGAALRHCDWGVGLEDFDNDGWKDLFVAQGHVLDNVEKIDSSLHYWELPTTAINHNGRFERADSGSPSAAAGRGAAFGDLNNDGWQDAVMTVLGGPPQIFLNRGGKQHWLVISLRGTRSNRDGLGARVRVNGQTRFATTAGSYLSANDKRLHFGLADADRAAVEVWWPSGAHQELKDVPVKQFLEVREPERP